MVIWSEIVSGDALAGLDRDGGSMEFAHATWQAVGSGRQEGPAQELVRGTLKKPAAGNPKQETNANRLRSGCRRDALMRLRFVLSGPGIGRNQAILGWHQVRIERDNCISPGTMRKLMVIRHECEPGLFEIGTHSRVASKSNTSWRHQQRRSCRKSVATLCLVFLLRLGGQQHPQRVHAQCGPEWGVEQRDERQNQA